MADITGTPGVDSLFGSLSADAIVALEGDDIAFGSDGDDAIFGNAGNDALAGNQGNDTINSGRDNDVILGGQGDDLGQGDDGNDWVFGNLGTDTLFGNIGDDSIFGGQGNDIIFAGQGNDFISGDFGNDVISGDRGTDSLSGGAGNDIFVLTKGGGGATPADADVILDFREGDRLGIAPGLTLADINIQFVAGSNSLGDVIIRDLSDNTGSYLAIVKNVSQTLITANTFTTNLTPLTNDDSGGGDGGGDDGGDGGGGTTGPVPPLARNLTLNIGEDTPISTQFDASDANNDPLTFSIIDAPTSGIASLFGLPHGFFSYTPGRNFSGSDSFTYQVNDGTALSNVATVNINIFSIEDVPVADAKTLTVDLQMPSPITLSGTDGDGDPLKFKILSLPPNGKLFQTADGTALGAEITEPNTVVANPQGIVIFVPNQGATGSASFEYVANDGKADSAGATVAFTLGNVLPNNAPGIDLNGDAEGLDFSANFTPDATPEDNQVSIVDKKNLNVGDADNDNIASAIVTIANLQDGGAEILAVDTALANANGITVNATTPGTLTLTGFASTTTYATVLRTLTYNNTDATPSFTTRTVTVVVNDGKENSVPAVSTVQYPLLPQGTDDTILVTPSTRGILPASAFLGNDSGIDLEMTVSGVLPTGVTPTGSPITSLTFNNATGGTFGYTLTDDFGNTSTATVSVSTVNSTTGNDTIVGGDGSDLLRGQRGADTLTGGSGSDVFIYQDARDGSDPAFTANNTAAITTAIGQNRHDVITDFVRRTDQIGITSNLLVVNDFTSVLPAVQTDITANVLSGNQRIFAFDNGVNTYLIYDGNSNNTNGADSRIFAQLLGVTGLGTLRDTDFSFIL
jgi:Bacterial Ig domain/RTX calcium-binding nonapeptide repeat (4 copies)